MEWADIFLSGAFFPREQLPDWLAAVAGYLPLALIVDAMRSLYAGELGQIPALLGTIMVYAVLGLCLAVVLTERRFSKAGG